MGIAVYDRHVNEHLVFGATSRRGGRAVDFADAPEVEVIDAVDVGVEGGLVIAGHLGRRELVEVGGFGPIHIEVRRRPPLGLEETDRDGDVLACRDTERVRERNAFAGTPTDY